MTNPVEDRSATSKWFWIIILILMLVLVIFWFADPLGQTEPAPPAKPAAR